MRLPKGFIFGESINGVVTIQRPKVSVLPETDVASVRDQLAKFRHLQSYRVETKDKSIIVYEPVGMDAIEALSKVGSPSMLDSIKAMVGPYFEAAIAKTAKDMGISVEEFKRIDAIAKADRDKRTIKHLLRNIQYSPVMKFTFDPRFGPYQAERRSYRGNEDWATLGTGPLEKLLKRYIRHIGKESFFELMQ